MGIKSRDSRVNTSFQIPDFCRDRSVFFLVIVAEVFVVLLLLADSDRGGFDWIRFAMLTLHVQWVCLASAALLCTFKNWLSGLSQWRAIAAAMAIILAMGLVVTIFGQKIMFGSGEIRWDAVVRQLAMTALIAALVLRYFYLQQQLVERSRSELSARLQALHSRIRPHFLFNSMNIIASLIPTQPDQAEKAVEDLADLFRASLKESDEQVTLTQEIELCERFMFIEKLRLGDRLKITWDLQADTNKWRVPQLCLQPLLENAVIHGIQGLPNGGEILVKVYESGATLKITIVNPVSDQPRKKSKGNQVALANIENRLQTIYGEQAKIFTRTSEAEFVAIMSLPRKRPQNGRPGRNRIKGNSR